MKLPKILATILLLQFALTTYGQSCSPTIIGNGCTFANSANYTPYCNGVAESHNSFDWSIARDQSLVFQNSAGYSGISSLYNASLNLNSAFDNGLEFYAGGKYRMRIKANGNVGIRTASPKAQFHIGSTDNATFSTLYPVSSATAYNSGCELKDDMGFQVNSYIQLYEYSSANNGNSSIKSVKTMSDIVAMGWKNTTAAYPERGGSVLRFCTNSQNDNSTQERMRIDRNGVVGIGTYGIDLDNANSLAATGSGGVYTGSNIKFYVNADMYATGVYWASSDARFKTNVASVGGALDKILKLNGVSYNYLKEVNGRKFSQNKTFGFIAQDLEKVLPELTTKDGEGFYMVNYQGLIPVLTEAIKEQQHQIESLKSQLASIKTGKPGSNDLGVKLYQNNPNPFTESTVINYFIPAGAINAQCTIYDMSGRTVKVYNLTAIGEGNLTINGGEMKAGSYIYSLSANGIVIDSKIMMLVSSK